MSYENMVMYGSVIPNYSSKKKKKGREVPNNEEVIDADNPKNKDVVHKILFG